ncbi:MAG: prolipoprotein diacylglyceryl transferase [Pseudobdellovibrionaceae bacterium]
MFSHIEISPYFIIPTYLLFLSALYCALVLWTAKKAESKNYPVKDSLDLGFAIMIGGFLGARLLHVFFENPEYYKADWKKILYVWEGGFVFFGGAFGALIASLVILKIKKISFAIWADFFAPIFALGYGVGRLSCLLAGCCYGRSTHLPWSIEGRHPTQLYAVFFELLVFAFLVAYEKRKLQKFSGEIFVIWIFLHGVGRLMMELFRDDFRGSQILSLSISTWIAILLILISSSIYALKRLSKVSS